MRAYDMPMKQKITKRDDVFITRRGCGCCTGLAQTAV